MKYETFKSKVRDKFGSIQRFMTVTGVTQRDLDTIFKMGLKGKKRMNRITKLIEKCDPTLEDKDVTPEDIELVRIALRTQHHSIVEFSEKNPRYTNTWISCLLNGKLQRKTQKVKDFFKILNIPHEPSKPNRTSRKGS